MTKGSVAERHDTRKTIRHMQPTVTEAAVAYRSALFAFADGAIAWAELLARCRQLRAAVRAAQRSRREASA